MTTTENSSTKFKVLIGILSALLIALAVYTITLYNDSKSTDLKETVFAFDLETAQQSKAWQV